MIFPTPLRVQLIACLRQTEDADSLELFTDDHDEFEVNFRDDTRIDIGFNNRVPILVRLLIKKNTIHIFIEKYVDGKTNPSVRQFYKDYQQYYSRPKPGKWVLNQNLFRRPLLLKKLPFIDRKEFAAAMWKLVSGRANLVTVYGESKSGQSYLSYYLNELDVTLKCFKVHEVNLKKISLDKSVPHISAYHIASSIGSRLGMDVGEESKFKVQEFINSLNTFLEDDESDPDNKDESFLFFIDQFNVSTAGDVDAMILNLATLATTQNKFYLVLSGYPGLQSWDFNLRALAEDHPLEKGTLEEEHIDEFAEHLYAHLKEEYDLELKLADFKSHIKQLLPQTLFVPANAEAIGKEITTWFKKFESSL